MKEKRLAEITAELAEIESRANGLEPLAETAEQAAIDERSKVLAEIKESREKLLAEKEQIQRMVKTLLALPELPQNDAADALAMAICHANSQSRISSSDPI